MTLNSSLISLSSLCANWVYHGMKFTGRSGLVCNHLNAHGARKNSRETIFENAIFTLISHTLKKEVTMESTRVVLSSQNDLTPISNQSDVKEACTRLTSTQNHSIFCKYIKKWLARNMRTRIKIRIKKRTIWSLNHP